MPPHLNTILLNSDAGADPYVLPAPSHVTLNHLYVYGNEASDDVVVTGMTQRFRTKAFANIAPKFVTTVYYMPKSALQGPATRPHDADSRQGRPY